jgi:arylformamidase
VVVNSTWIDISVPLRPGMVVWPGDAPFKRSDTLRIAGGGACNLSQISTTAHVGTHMDAPRHFLENAAGMESLPLEAVIGPTRVIAIQDPEAIRVAELEPHSLGQGERVLLRTRNSEVCWNTDHFQSKFIYMPPETAHYLVERGVQTVGVDYLSVDAFHSEDAPTHRILLKAGVWIIEGLMLGHVEPGRYELVCLPLKIVGGDGAPARAALRKSAA